MRYCCVILLCCVSTACSTNREVVVQDEPVAGVSKQDERAPAPVPVSDDFLGIDYTNGEVYTHTLLALNGPSIAFDPSDFRLKRSCFQTHAGSISDLTLGTDGVLDARIADNGALVVTPVKVGQSSLRARLKFAMSDEIKGGDCYAFQSDRVGVEVTIHVQVVADARLDISKTRATYSLGGSTFTALPDADIRFAAAVDCEGCADRFPHSSFHYKTGMALFRESARLSYNEEAREFIAHAPKVGEPYELETVFGQKIQLRAIEPSPELEWELSLGHVARGVYVHEVLDDGTLSKDAALALYLRSLRGEGGPVDFVPREIDAQVTILSPQVCETSTDPNGSLLWQDDFDDPVWVATLRPKRAGACEARITIAGSTRTMSFTFVD